MPVIQKLRLANLLTKRGDEHQDVQGAIRCMVM
jgi:hypothetical protein